MSQNLSDFIIKKFLYDLSSPAGLAFVCKHLKCVNVNALIDLKVPVRSGFANNEILKPYLALLCMGKSDFDITENFRENAFFKPALVLGTVPSSPILRQRMDTHAAFWFDAAPQMNWPLLSNRINGQPTDLGAPACGDTPVDLGTFTLDNSGTQINELVGRTYAGADGDCPFTVYSGSLGYCLELALRPKVQHSAAEPDAPVRHKAKRRRIKTVMQEFMFKAARMIHGCRPWVLGLGASDPVFSVGERH